MIGFLKRGRKGDNIVFSLLGYENDFLEEKTYILIIILTYKGG